MDWDKEATKIANWMKKYAADAGSKGLLIGLSGGIDSSVVACLAVRAVGKENVIGISLPCQSKEDMKTDALELADNLGIKFGTIAIEGVMAKFENRISEFLYPFPEEKFINDLTKGNAKARLRMTALYAGVDMEPLGEYYKTQVNKLAEGAFGDLIPKAVMTKAPTADLWGGQTDEQEIGMSYEQLDVLISRAEPDWEYVDYGDGATEEDFNRIKSMMMKSDHKNNVPPQYPR